MDAREERESGRKPEHGDESESEREREREKERQVPRSPRGRRGPGSVDDEGRR